MPARRRALSTTAALLLSALALAGCTGDPTTSGDSAPSGGRGTSPLQNPDGTKPGLAPITSAADLGAARDLIAKVRTAAAGPKDGYDRDQFGPAWTDNVEGWRSGTTSATPATTCWPGTAGRSSARTGRTAR